MLASDADINGNDYHGDHDGHGYDNGNGHGDVDCDGAGKDGGDDSSDDHGN